MPFRRSTTPADDNNQDTTGHGRWRMVQPAEDDTDGHRRKFRGLEPAEDDTDGHMSRGKG